MAMTKQASMLRTILVYGAVLAAGTFVLEWLQFRFLVQRHAVEAYVVLVAGAFLGLGGTHGPGSGRSGDLSRSPILPR